MQALVGLHDDKNLEVYIRRRTGSQCRFFKTGEMWALFPNVGDHTRGMVLDQLKLFQRRVRQAIHAGGHCPCQIESPEGMNKPLCCCLWEVWTDIWNVPDIAQSIAHARTITKFFVRMAGSASALRGASFNLEGVGQGLGDVPKYFFHSDPGNW